MDPKIGYQIWSWSMSKFSNQSNENNDQMLFFSKFNKQQSAPSESLRTMEVLQKKFKKNGSTSKSHSIYD